MVQKALVAGLLVLGLMVGQNAFAQAPASPEPPAGVRIVESAGAVEVLPSGSSAWIAATNGQILHPLDHIRTGVNSRVALRWSGESIVPFGASTELEILPPGATDDQYGLQLLHGVVSFFHRDKPGHIHIITHGAVAGVEGTEFILAVNDADVTSLAVVDGRVKLGNSQATLLLTNGEQAVVEPGKAPARVAGFIANNLLQWCFYYPAVLDLNDLQLTGAEKHDLANSLAAYRSGDLLAALAQYPDGRGNPSNQERIYHAALLLSVGEVDGSEQLLASVSSSDEHTQRLVDALHQLIAAVKRQPAVTSGPPMLATEFMAESYFQQSRAVRETSLRAALASARKAASLSPFSGFAWERVAELEFSFGDKEPALKALNESLALAPRNAQAHALKGFILAAQNRYPDALASFNDALAIDSSLGNAWLGRGLVRIHQRDNRGGRADLLVAAALEPQRAELRSYLGKAYAVTGDYAHADHELALAKKLDPNDPTAWLYSALLNQQGNQINDAIRDLEKSEALNDNRSVYRSQLLLDEDESVRAANLAGVYRDAGMFDWSVLEAGRAASSDYANYSSHLFLANSYNQLRDPNWSNLRYESTANEEYYIANLLAPPSAGVLSSVISEPAYLSLFDQNHLGVVSDTEYLSRGAWFQEGAQFGVYNDFSYDAEAKYTSDPGQRPNNDEEHRDLMLTLKYQFTPQDTAFASIEGDQIKTGDVGELYNPAATSTDYRFNEDQGANFTVGYHHEWSPGVHTLFFGARQYAEESAFDNQSDQFFGYYGTEGGAFTSPRFYGIFDFNGTPATQNIGITPEIYTAELQQIFETPNHTTIFGARYQWGDVQYKNTEADIGSPEVNSEFLQLDPFLVQDFSLNFREFSAYGYHTWQIADPLSVTAGFSYDWLHSPANVDTTPFATQEKATVQFSPKVGMIYTPFENTTIRAAYTRSLSGFTAGQTLRIEPTEVAGFNQSYRDIIPDSVAGDTSGSRVDTIDISLEQKFQTGTYVQLSGEILYSKLHRLMGDFVVLPDLPLNTFTFPLGFNQLLDYRERSLTASVDQLLGKQFTVGARYRASDAQLQMNYSDFDPTILIYGDPAPFYPRQTFDSLLQTVTMHVNWNHPLGFFSVLEANWYHQGNTGFTPAEPGDDFWQLNAYAGYRFWHRRAEVSVGLLNFTDQNYQLEPLNFYNEMARGRTFLARLLVTF